MTTEPGAAARSGRNGLHQAPEANQRDHSLDIIGQNIERHFGADILQPPRQEMGVPHPSLDRAERVFDRAAAQGHRVRVPAQPFAHRIDQMLMLPSRDPAFLTTGAAVPDRTLLTGIGPVATDLQPVFLARVAVGQLFTRGAGIDIACRVIGKIGLHIHTFGPVARGFRARHGRGDPRLMASQDLSPTEISLVGDGVKVVAPQGFLGGGRHWAELVSIETLIGNVVRHDQMRLGIDRCLHIVADHAAVPGAGRHGAGIGIDGACKCGSCSAWWW